MQYTILLLILFALVFGAGATVCLLAVYASCFAVIGLLAFVKRLGRAP